VPRVLALPTASGAKELSASRSSSIAADRVAAASRSVARAGDQINEMIMKGSRDRQEVMSRINDRWNRTTRQVVTSVEVYRDPSTGETFELPSGYSHVWTRMVSLIDLQRRVDLFLRDV
jgi:hypothetical protein